MKKGQNGAAALLTVLGLISCFICATVVVAGDTVTENIVKPSDLWSGNNIATFKNDVEIPDYAKYGLCYDREKGEYVHISDSTADLLLEEWERYGLACTSTGGTITFNNVVDITDYEKNDEILSVMFTPEKRGTAEIGSFAFTLTDAEDEENYFTFMVSLDSNINQYPGWQIDNPCVSVSQRKNSHTPLTGGAILLAANLKGETYHKGNTPTALLRNNYLKFSYSYAENTLYAFDQKEGVTKIVDFDDIDSIGPGNTWKGFTSGRVRLSITTAEMQAYSGKFMILGAFNQKMAGEVVADYEAPNISVDPIAKNHLKGEVGKCYKLFGATAYDVVDGIVEVTAKVKAPNGKFIDFTGDSFIPSVSGEYEIQYNAQDKAGHQASAFVQVICEEKLDALSINVLNDESMTAFNVGEEIFVPEIGVTGGSGNYLTTVTVVHRESNTIIQVTNNQFIPLFVGSYEIKYEVSDYIQNVGIKTLVYFAKNSDRPIKRGEIQQLKKMYCGVTFDIPVPEVYDYSDPMNGVRPAEYRIYITGSTGKEFEITDGTFVPDESYGNSVTVKYEMFITGREENKETFSYTIPLIEKMTSSFENMFTYNDSAFDVIVNEKDRAGFIRFDSKEGVSAVDMVQGITYALPLGEANIGLSYMIPDYSVEDNAVISSNRFTELGGYANYRYNYGKIRVEIRDSIDASIGFDYTIQHYQTGANSTHYNNQKTMVTLNGKVAILSNYLDFHKFNSVTGGYKAVLQQSSTPMKITYSDGALYDAGGNYMMTVDKGIDGKSFDGFPSHKAYITVKFEDVTGKVGISIITVGQTPMKTLYNKNGETYFNDMIPPKIKTLSGFKLKYAIGDEVKIPNAVAYDDFSAHISVFVTVKTPRGEIVGDFNKKPIGEGYSFTIEIMGDYSITYTAKDASGKTGTRSLSVGAIDEDAPTVVIDSPKEIRVKAEEAFTLPEAMVQDNVNAANELQVYIVLIDSAYKTRLIDNGNDLIEITSMKAPKTAGTYILRYVAIDSAYNIGYAQITLIVE